MKNFKRITKGFYQAKQKTYTINVASESDRWCTCIRDNESSEFIRPFSRCLPTWYATKKEACKTLLRIHAIADFKNTFELNGARYETENTFDNEEISMTSTNLSTGQQNYISTSFENFDNTAILNQLKDDLKIISEKTKRGRKQKLKA